MKFKSLTSDEQQILAPSFKLQMAPPYQDMAGLEILKRDVAFYPGWQFLDISPKERIRDTHIYALVKGDDMMVLDWSAERIYAINTQAGLELTKANIASYLTFFLNYTRGAGGRMRLVESVDDFRWREEPPLSARKAIAGMIRPVTVIGHQEDENSYLLKFHVLFQNHLFACEAQVSDLGRVELLDRELQVEDIPLLDDVIGQ